LSTTRPATPVYAPTSESPTCVPTNVAMPLGLWTPVLTNQFDQYGVLTYTNVYNPALTQQYFRFLVP